MSKEIWLGLATTTHPTDADGHGEAPGEADPYVMRLGGHPVWLYPGLRSQHSLRCPNPHCGLPLSLLAQMHAPLGGADRVLYILVCRQTKCHYFAAFRATLRHRVPAPAPPPPETFDTTEADDWGDEDPKPKVAVVAVVPEPVVIEEPSWEGPPPLLDTSLPPYPATWLDPVEEAEAYKPFKARAEALEQRMRSHAVLAAPDPSIMEDPMINREYEPTQEDKCLRSYLKHMDKCGSQVVRWSLGGTPLLLRTERLEDLDVPPCPSCGASRRFEAQVLSTAVYLLNGTNEGEITFGTVLIFTCGDGGCGEGEWVEDYVHVQEGI